MKYSYKLLLSIVTLFVAFSSIVFSALTITNPIKGQSYRVGKSIPITWDTTGQTTYNKTFKFYWTEEGTTSWKVLPLPKGKTEFLDASGGKAIGLVNTTLPNIDNKFIYIRMVDKNDTTKFSDAVLIKVTMPAPSVVDSTLKGDITQTLTLSATKIYGLDGVVYVQSGATLRLEPGTIIKGDNTKTSAICINRGAKIYANGTLQKPIIMTSGLPVGQRDRGDWGGLLIMGNAKTNLIEAPIEGGISDASTVKKNAWFGGTDDADSSGILRYVRVEFAGIAESPDNELNGITFGAVGNKTIVDYVQASYSGDDSFEWFGGTVNCKHLIAYNGIDDDFDTDNGYRGKLQFGISRRFNDIADASNSEAFESDNDANATENQPFTQPIFSNFTVIGGVQDTSFTAWTAGADYATRYHPKFLTSAQIRRNSRMSLFNSVIIGWPAGVELTGNNTVRAVNADSVQVKYNDFYGIRGNKVFYAGSSTTFSGNINTGWLLGVSLGNTLSNGAGDVGTFANVNDAFAKNNSFNPSPKATASYLNSATYTDAVLTDSFFEKVAYRGANGLQRWDAGWVEYDPINKDYKAFVAPPTKTNFISPKANSTFRIGRSVAIQWDTTAQLTNGKTLKFYWSESANSTTWNILPMPKGKLEFVDGTVTQAIGTVNTTMPNFATTSLYIKLEDKNSTSFSAVVGPISVTMPAPSVVDSTLKGDIIGTITLSSKKIYGLDGVVYVQSGATLRIEPGTIIKGDNTKTSAICINRGAKIYANGTSQKPIVMTSGLPVGQRDRGDWGGLLIMGNAKTNLIEAPIEGGIADASTIKKNAWFGGTDDADSSGILRYVRVEFAGIAESPDNELNGITFGAVGNKTIVDYVQASYSGDDSFEWFGGTVNCKHIIAYNGIDDDFDTDNGYRGKLQFGISRRFNDIADISNSEAFESDNDANATENQPFTNPIFSNFTAIGGVMDTSYTAWSAGADYSTRYHPKFLTSAQIRRNSRMALYNSVLVGWPAGVELTNNNTVRAANADSVRVKYNDFYGIKANKYFYAGGSTTFSGTVSTNWLATAGFGNTMTNGTGNVSTLAGLNDAFAKGSTFNPSPIANATFLTSANFTDLTDSFFDKVTFRGAMDATNRWDIGWTEYDPINKEYKLAPTQTAFISPKANDKFRVGRSIILQWDTTSHLSNGKTLKFYWSLSANSTSWTILPMPKGKLEFVDGTALKATGTVNTTMPNLATASLYIKLEDKNDATFNSVVGPITVTIPTAGEVDSTLKGDITGTVTLSSTKIYGLDGVVYVQNGGVLRINPGTVIKGDNTKTSAICVNRGGIIYANGTAQKPIVMTSGQPVGQRERGDWGGLLIMGKAKSNLVEAPIEGGIADDATVKKNAWFGGTDDADSSGVLRYVRVEFGGIAESPDNELNGITFGAVGNRTVVDYVQSSYSGDDSFEWFGGTVNCKHIIAYNGIDDDFDTDNGYRGKLQFGIGRRFNDIADISNSEAFESDNDASASENQPFTNPIFSNFTAIGGVMDTSYTAWSAGADYSTRYHPKFLTAAQIRRNSRMALYNSVLVGWPAGVELTNNNTVRAANADSVRVKYNDFYGIKANKYFYAGGSTTFSGTVSTNWLATAGFGNTMTNGTGNVSTLAGLNDAFAKGSTFNPAPKANSTFLTSANFADLSDTFYDKVAYRGANGLQRWDAGWVEYDPINKDYVTTGVEEDLVGENKLDVNISPLPAIDFTSVRYFIPTNSNVSVKFFNATGSIASTYFENENQVTGYYEFNLSTKDLSAGVYYLVVTTEFGSITKKVVVVK